MSDRYQVHIENGFMTDTFDVFLYERWGDAQMALLQPNNKRYIGNIAETIPEAERIPIFRLPREAAHQFLAALSRQLGAVEHPEQLRKDYEAERGRVDKFIDYITSGVR